MDKTYTVTLADEYTVGGKIGVPVTIDGNHTAWIRTGIELTPYTEPDLDAIRNEAYEKGVQDTKQHWVDAPRTCAYKLGYENGLNDAREGKASCQYCRFTDVRQDMQPCASCSNNYDNKFEPEEQIRVGDEVTTASGKAVVTGVGPVHFEYVYADGSHGYDEVKNVKKTGKHFPEIATVLQKMREKE